jgi:hypothetical protein
MLQFLPHEVLDKVLFAVPSKTLRRSVRSSCKALRPKQSDIGHPTHAEQAQMMEMSLLSLYRSADDPKDPYDNPFLLQLYRAYKTPHTRSAFVFWNLTQLIYFDEKGFYARVPHGCTLYNAEGVECRRMRVQLWDRVNRSKRGVLRLLDGVEARAYMPKGTSEPSRSGV